MTQKSNVYLRLCDLSDAKFLLQLRSGHGQFLSKTSDDIEVQKQWLERYKKRELDEVEFYFVIEEGGIPIGCVRLYEIEKRNKAFTFGSFIVDKALSGSKLSALAAMVSVFGFAFQDRALTFCRFDCRKENRKANDFYKRFGAKVVDEDDLDIFYEYTREDYQNNYKNYLKALKND